jgi:hypothetical protein
MKLFYEVSISRDDDLLKVYRKKFSLSRHERRVLREIFGV